MSDRKICLGHVAKVIQGGRLGMSGKHFVDRGFPAYGAGGLNGMLPTFEFDRPGIVLSSIGARCGKCFLAEGKWSSLANTQLIFPEEDKADIRFIWYQLNDEKGWIRRGAGQPFIRPSDVKARRIFFPPLDEQRRIAATLDKAEGICRKRHQALAETDALLRATFLDIFGDPASNPHGFDIRPVEEGLSIKRSGTQSGPFGSALKKQEYVKSGIPVWGIENVENGRFISGAKLFITPAKFEQLRRYDVRPGDVLISRAGTVGRMCIAAPPEDRSIISTNIIRVVLDEERLVPEYFVTIFTAFPDRIGRLKSNRKDNAFTFLNPATLRMIEIPFPPKRLQLEFCKKLRAIRAHESSLYSHLSTADQLFGSLSQQAFRGQL